MAFELNQIFENTYPPEAAGWCNSNNAVIKELDKVDGKRRFQIQAVPEPTKDELASQIRSQRDALIAETDYLMASDYPIADERRTELAAYRQALRDVPEQEEFPTNVVWPEKPEWLK